jgi:hypothetical protein
VKLFRGFSFTLLLCLQTNVGTVDAHVADYQQMIDNLQVIALLDSLYTHGHTCHWSFCSSL